MRDELEAALRSAYPRTFARLPPIEHGDGWFLILWNLCAQLEPLGVEAVQVKQKFGALRFYLADYPDAVDPLIAHAEYLSARTCEVCGQPGKIRDDGWLRALCDGHAAPTCQP